MIPGAMLQRKMRNYSIHDIPCNLPPFFTLSTPIFMPLNLEALVNDPCLRKDDGKYVLHAAGLVWKDTKGRKFNQPVADYFPKSFQAEVGGIEITLFSWTITWHDTLTYSIDDRRRNLTLYAENQEAKGCETFGETAAMAVDAARTILEAYHKRIGEVLPMLLGL